MNSDTKAPFQRPHWRGPWRLDRDAKEWRRPMSDQIVVASPGHNGNPGGQAITIHYFVVHHSERVKPVPSRPPAPQPTAYSRRPKRGGDMMKEDTDG